MLRTTLLQVEGILSICVHLRHLRITLTFGVFFEVISKEDYPQMTQMDADGVGAPRATGDSQLCGGVGILDLAASAIA